MNIAWTEIGATIAGLGGIALVFNRFGLLDRLKKNTHLNMEKLSKKFIPREEHGLICENTLLKLSIDIKGHVEEKIEASEKRIIEAIDGNKRNP